MADQRRAVARALAEGPAEGDGSLVETPVVVQAPALLGVGVPAQQVRRLELEADLGRDPSGLEGPGHDPDVGVVRQVVDERADHRHRLGVPVLQQVQAGEGPLPLSRLQPILPGLGPISRVEAEVPQEVIGPGVLGIDPQAVAGGVLGLVELAAVEVGEAEGVPAVHQAGRQVGGQPQVGPGLLEVLGHHELLTLADEDPRLLLRGLAAERDGGGAPGPQGQEHAAAAQDEAQGERCAGRQGGACGAAPAAAGSR